MNLTSMPELSPQAQAVLNAVTLKRYDAPYYACPKSIDQIRSDVSAALQAAADQVEQKWRGLGHEACQEIRAIADELKAQ